MENFVQKDVILNFYKNVLQLSMENFHFWSPIRRKLPFIPDKIGIRLRRIMKGPQHLDNWLIHPKIISNMNYLSLVVFF